MNSGVVGLYPHGQPPTLPPTPTTSSVHIRFACEQYALYLNSVLLNRIFVCQGTKAILNSQSVLVRVRD